MRAATVFADGRAKLQMTVVDNGIGMSGEQLARVFDPFEQADASIATEYGGTGLGLSISRRLARMLDGDVWFESELGVGTKAFLSAAIDLEPRGDELADAAPAPLKAVAA